MSEDIENDDPFAPENFNHVLFIMLSRIYDVLLANTELNSPEVSEMLIDLHSRGDLLGLPPTLSGRFVAEEQIAKERREANEQT